MFTSISLNTLCTPHELPRKLQYSPFIPYDLYRSCIKLDKVKALVWEALNKGRGLQILLNLNISQPQMRLEHEAFIHLFRHAYEYLWPVDPLAPGAIVGKDPQQQTSGKGVCESQRFVLTGLVPIFIAWSRSLPTTFVVEMTLDQVSRPQLYHLFVVVNSGLPVEK